MPPTPNAQPAAAGRAAPPRARACARAPTPPAPTITLLKLLMPGFWWCHPCLALEPLLFGKLHTCSTKLLTHKARARAAASLLPTNAASLKATPARPLSLIPTGNRTTLEGHIAFPLLPGPHHSTPFRLVSLHSHRHASGRCSCCACCPLTQAERSPPPAKPLTRMHCRRVPPPQRPIHHTPASKLPRPRLQACASCHPGG